MFWKWILSRTPLRPNGRWMCGRVRGDEHVPWLKRGEDAILFHAPVVSISSLWFSEQNLPSDRKKNNKASPLESFYIPGEVSCAQSEGCDYRVSREWENFYNAGWNSIPKADEREPLQKCHHPTVQANWAETYVNFIFFCLNSMSTLLS